MRELHGTGALMRLIVARDKVRLLAWIAAILLLVLTTVASTKDIYPTQADLDEAAALAQDNPIALAFNGPDQALDTIGGQIAFQIGAFGLLIVGLMSLLLLGRITRGEEESGRLELVRSMPVGRHAPLAAGLIVVIGANVVLGLLTTLTLLGSDLPTTGSIVFGAAFTAFGLAFVGITALAAQVSENPRVAMGAAGGVLGAAFLIRAAGDMGDGTLSWLSPIGWAQKARPYAHERWWPLLLCVALGAGLIWAAAALSVVRDFGSGLVPPKPGPPRAAPSLGSPLGLAVRLHRGATFWWCLGTLVLGLTYGSLVESIEDFVSDNEALLEIIAGYGEASLTDSYLTTSLLIIALLAVGPGLQIAVRLRTEESAERAEAMLATPISRWAWARSHLTAALVASGLALALGGVGLGGAYAIVGGGARQVPRLLVASLAYLPAIWLLVALAVALFGLVPRWTGGGWVGLGVAFAIGMFGPMLDLPMWVMDLSPLQHTPAVPADPVRPLPLAILSAVAVGLVALGLTRFRARDLVTA